MMEDFEALLDRARLRCDECEKTYDDLIGKVNLSFNESSILATLYAQTPDVFSVGEAYVASRHNKDLLTTLTKQIRAQAFITEKTSKDKVTDSLATSRVEVDAVVVTAQSLLARAENIFANFSNLHNAIGERGDAVKVIVKNMWLMEKAAASQSELEGGASFEIAALRKKKTEERLESARKQRAERANG